MITYKSSSSKGQIAQDLFTDYLTRNNKKYVDLSMCKLGHDIVIPSTGKKYEVKCQTYNDSIILEDISQYEIPGWSITSDADYLLEINIKSCIMLYMSMPEIKDWYIKNRDRYKQLRNEQSEGLRLDRWYSYFRICPLRDITIDIKRIQL